MEGGSPIRQQSSRGLARREAILRDATAEFLQRGYERATVAAIVQRAGGSNSSVYKMFGDKAGLFREVVMRETAQLSERLASQNLQFDGFEDGLRQFATIYLTSLSSARLKELFSATLSEIGRFPEVNQALSLSVRSMTEVLAELVRNHHDPERYRIPDAEEFALFFLCMLRGRAQIGWFDYTPASPSFELAAFIERWVEIATQAYAK